MIYVYDGTFEGFLTALAVIRQTGGTLDGITRTPPSCGSLFAETTEVGTDQDMAVRFAAGVAAAISPSVLSFAFRAFLAESSGGELLIHRYLEFGRLKGRQLDGMLSHERVAPVHRLAGKVGREAHRMKGFVRFREVRGGIFYAQLEPDHHVLPLIARHFADRFRDQNWIIHDLRRGKGVIHDAASGEWVLTDLGVDIPPEATDRELDFQRLWKGYFEHVSVGERLNLRLQQNKLPLKYRRHLVEF